MQAIYQWLISDNIPVSDIEKQFSEDQEMQGSNAGHFSELLQGVVANENELSDLMAPYLSRPFNEVDPVEQAVLLIAVYELRHIPATPCRVVINEAIELTKVYGAEAAHRFVNGVLDKLADDLRPAEKDV